MFQKLDLLKTAMSMARHAGYRQALTSQNIANADTPGFRSLRVADFASYLPAPRAMALRQGHAAPVGFASDRDMSAVLAKAQEPNGNGVTLETEILLSVDARRQHDRALSIYQASLGMLRSTLSKQ